jgi:tetratricopeptide (TPR) repeat protein
MASVFLSYDRDDGDRARHFAQAFEQAGHEVWWDLHVRGGAQFSKVIEEALKAADAVVVLWSARSIESAWVRDEAAAGRDSGRLVPVTIDGTEPPLGFRQYQTTDLRKWKGRGTPPELRVLLADIEALASQAGATRTATVVPHPSPAATPRFRGRLLAVASMAVFALIAAAGVYWFLSGRSSGPPTVAVVAADNSALSRDMARNLLVKLGSLQGNASTNVRLLEEAGAAKQADLRITISGSMESGQPQASVTVASSSEGAVLWSRDFGEPGTSRSDLEEQIATSTARVLGCTIASSGTSAKLSNNSRQIYLNACAMSSETGWDKRPVIQMLRQVVNSSPRFAPAWALLLNSEADVVSLLASTDEDVTALRRQLRSDIARARTVDAGMAEATLAELQAEPNIGFARQVYLVDKAKDQEPDNPTVLGIRSQVMNAIGRMNEAVNDAGRAAQLDPLSPTATAWLIYALTYSGQDARARDTVARAKRLWPEARAIHDAEHALELRKGDFERAITSTDFAVTPVTIAYIAARKNPSDANVSAFITAMQKRGMSTDDVVFAVQGLGEMNRVTDIFDLAQQPKVVEALARNSYVLFRPWLANLRRDPRFMGLARQIGLLSYWAQSGKWPDFCTESDLPYDCKKEAAKLTA